MLGTGDVCDIHLVINEIGEDIAPPCGQGWQMDDGQLSIRWTGGDLLPQDLVGLLSMFLQRIQISMAELMMNA